MNDGHGRVGAALMSLQSALSPFVAERMLAKYGPDWRTKVSWPGGVEASGALDSYASLKIIIDHWSAVFRHKFRGHRNARNLIGMALEIRNAHAHATEPFDDFSALDALSNLAKLLSLVGADIAHARVRTLWDEQRRSSPLGATAAGRVTIEELDAPSTKAGTREPPDALERSFVIQLQGPNGFHRTYYGPVLLTRANLRGAGPKESLQALESTALDIDQDKDRLRICALPGCPPCTLDRAALKTGERRDLSLGNHTLEIAGLSFELGIDLDPDS